MLRINMIKYIKNMFFKFAGVFLKRGQDRIG